MQEPSPEAVSPAPQGERDVQSPGTQATYFYNIIKGTQSAETDKQVHYSTIKSSVVSEEPHDSMVRELEEQGRAKVRELAAHCPPEVVEHITA